MSKSGGSAMTTTASYAEQGTESSVYNYTQTNIKSSVYSSIPWSKANFIAENVDITYLTTSGKYSALKSTIRQMSLNQRHLIFDTWREREAFPVEVIEELFDHIPKSWKVEVVR